MFAVELKFKTQAMKKTIFLAMLLMSFMQVFAQAAADKIIGIWETEAKDAKMQVFKSGNKYQAKLLWGKEIVNADGSSKKDVNNTDQKLRHKNLVGSIFLKNLSYQNQEWDKGLVYNNSNGKWYKCYVQMENGQLLLTGYLGMRWLGQTTVWNLINQ